MACLVCALIAGTGCGSVSVDLDELADDFAEFCASEASRAPASVTLSPYDITLLEPGETYSPSVEVADACGRPVADATVVWSVEPNPETAVSVSSDGVITAVDHGRSFVYATSGSATGQLLVSVLLFRLAENGVTVVCPDVDAGDRGWIDFSIDGFTETVDFVKVSRPQLDSLLAIVSTALPTSLPPKACTSGVADMSALPSVDVISPERFEWLDVGAWDVSSVTDMSAMFDGATGLDSDLSAWDVSEVTNMDAMFRNATAFDQDLSGWCVINVLTPPAHFDAGATSWTLPRPVWGTCPGG